MTKSRHVLAVDPGLATGVALFSIEPGGEPVLLDSWEVKFDTFPVVVRQAFATYPDIEVVCEKFTITVETAKKSASPYSLEEIGCLKLMMLDAGLPWDNLPLQLPGNAKAMFPNPKLKKLGYWHRGGAGHALDAIRHGLLYLVRTGWTPSKLLD